MERLLGFDFNEIGSKQISFQPKMSQFASQCQFVNISMSSDDVPPVEPVTNIFLFAAVIIFVNSIDEN